MNQLEIARKTGKPITAVTEIQSLLLEMLVAVHSFLDANGIYHTLACGTLIGAIRHKGFIPWDDDLDLWITAEGRDKIIEIAKKNPYIDKAKRYKILIPGAAPSIFPFLKIVDTYTAAHERCLREEYTCELWIDLFAQSYVPDDQTVIQKKIIRHRRYRKILGILKINRETLFRNKSKLTQAVATVFITLLRCIGMNEQYWCRKIMQQEQTEKTGRLWDLCWASKFSKYDAEWFTEVDYADFCGHRMPIPKGYDKMLQMIYGDYMTLPPEEKRVTHSPEIYLIKTEKTGR